MENFKISIFQMKVTDNKEINIRKAVEGANIASKTNCKIFVLPEMFNCPYEHSYFDKFAETEFEGETLKAIISAAVENNIYIIAGSIPERCDGKIYNTSYTISNEGRIINKYRKLHLFDIDIKDKITFFESNTLEKGSEIKTFVTPFCNMGVVICYDIRFPEVFINMSKQDIKVAVIPGAFNSITGPAHWRMLARARAVDNQAFIVMASPALNRESSYQAYGHSLICDPWGTILCEAGHNEEIIEYEINLDFLDKIRAELPILKHKRSDLY